MTNDKGDAIREALLSRLEPWRKEPSGELGNRFQEQIDTLLRHRLRPWEKWLRGCVAVFFAAGAVGQAWGGFLFLSMTSPGIRDDVRVAIGCLFFFGAAVFLFGALALVYDIRTGRASHRKMQKAILGLTMLPILVVSILALMYVPRMDLPLDRQLHIFAYVIIFWIGAQTQVILARADWNRQDIILEQKRTQLEIAMLREELAGRP